MRNKNYVPNDSSFRGKGKYSFKGFEIISIILNGSLSLKCVHCIHSDIEQRKVSNVPPMI